MSRFPARGRRPAATRTAASRVRPTAARVRDALFNILGEAVTGATVLDLFAGTGALGIEALRRGAARAVFVERDPREARALREALRDLDGRGEVRCEEALAAVARLGQAGETFALILLDPPYGEGWIPRTLAAIAAAGLLAPGGMIVAEGHWRDRPQVGNGLVMSRESRYGETMLWFIHSTARQ